MDGEFHKVKDTMISMRNCNYNIDEINFQLDSRGHRTMTNWRRPADK